ncbi:hypothetical protein [Helicobacter pylori]|nr:hypothetical protein [Helicobacter pylori]MDO7817881.1 hypothetical protein [Helicobacter pylori]MDO7823273.1 hypothetical protein [Helicobacter pylori]
MPHVTIPGLLVPQTQNYDECEVTDKIKILGNIQKYQMDMLKFRP